MTSMPKAALGRDAVPISGHRRPFGRSLAPRLPQSVYNAMRYGHPNRFKGDLHAQASWAIGRAVYAGIHDVDEMVELLTMPGNAGGAGAWWWRRVEHPNPARRSSVSRMRRDIERKIENCRTAWKSPILDASQARMVIGELYDRAIDADWLGRTATIDRKVYIAHCRMAIEAGHIADYGASIRQLAIEANVTKDTIRAANERLLTAGAIQRVDRPQARSSRWRLVRAWGDKLMPCDLGTEEVAACRDFVPPSHPAFAHGSGLHYATWLALRDDSLTARAITESLNREGKNAVRQTRHRLEQLEKAGLAKRCDDGWHRSGSRATLDALALERGTTKRMNERRELYKLESRTHRTKELLGKRLAVLLRAAPATTAQLAVAAEAAEPAVREVIDEMRARDYIALLPDGRWALPHQADPEQLPIAGEGFRSLETLGLQIRAELDHGRRTERELAIALTASVAQVREAIDHLQHNGIVWRSRGKTWSLTPDTTSIDRAEKVCPLDLAT